MSDLRPDNGGGKPPEDGGARRGLPDLPPEWGTIVIPDNAAELDADASELRRERRREALRTRVWTAIGLGPGRRRDAASLGVPVVIMAVAVITTLLSLFVVTWDHRPNATAPAGPEGAAQASAVPIADVALTDAAGSRVLLRNVLPAVLLLVEDCDCAELINAIADATPPPVTVIPVSAAAACTVASKKNVLCLADPAGALTTRYPTPKAALSAATPLPATSPAAPGASASPAPTPVPIPTALAVPVDADGTALDPILVDSTDDLVAAIAALTADD